MSPTAQRVGPVMGSVAAAAGDTEGAATLGFVATPGCVAELPPQATRMATKTSATNHPTGAATWAWRVIGRSSAARGDCWD